MDVGRKDMFGREGEEIDNDDVRKEAEVSDDGKEVVRQMQKTMQKTMKVTIP